MSGFSFATGAQRVKIGKVPQVNTSILPFSPNLAFNRIIHPANGRVREPIRSINASTMLKAIETNRTNNLMKITLGCTQTKDGVALWDVIFNQAEKQGINSCLFVVDKDYNPVEQTRVVTSSHFMNYGFPSIRTHLNKVEVGDRIGVGIYNCARMQVHVLLYEVVGNCFASDTVEESNQRGRRNGNKSDYRVVHAVNCELVSVYRFDRHGNGMVTAVREGEAGEADAKKDPKLLVERIVNSVMDIDSAYPFKPHFLPEKIDSWDRDVMEAKIEELMTTVMPGSYDDFEDAAREAYNQGRQMRISANKGDGEDKPAVKPLVPVVEVVSLGGETIIATVLNRNTNTSQTFRFPVSTMGKNQTVEKFLANKDVTSTVAMQDDSNFLVLPDRFGEGSFVRFLSVNF